MADLLVKLYEIPSAQPDIDALAEKNIVIRRPIGPENWGVIAWIKEHFDAGWASEAGNAFFRSPKSIYIAIRETKDLSAETAAKLEKALTDFTAIFLAGTK